MKIYSFRDERNEFHHWYECRGEACDAARVHYNCNNEIAEVELHCDTEIEDISSNLFRVYVVIDNRTSAPVEAFLHANDAMHYCENSDDAYNMVKAAVQLAQQYPNVSDTYYVTIDHDKDDSTKFVTRFNAHPEHDGWCCAGKYYFPDRSWENPAVGPARVKILREKENYGFIVGEMVNPTLPEDLTETLNVIIRYMPDLDRVDVMKTSSGDTVIRTLKISNDYHRYEEYRYFAYVDDELIGSSIYGSDRSKTDAFVDYMSNQTCTLVKTIYNARTDKLQKLINMTMDEIDAIFDACKKRRTNLCIGDMKHWEVESGLLPQRMIILNMSKTLSIRIPMKVLIQICFVWL